MAQTWFEITNFITIVINLQALIKTIKFSLTQGRTETPMKVEQDSHKSLHIEFAVWQPNGRLIDWANTVAKLQTHKEGKKKIVFKEIKFVDYLVDTLIRLYRIGDVVEVLFYFPIPSSLVMSLVKLNCMVLCHGNSVRVTGSFLRRSCSATRIEELQPIQTSNKKLKWPTITIG